ncbi:FAM172 family protein homolog CG10038 [Sergentomyia squamirostris]
MLSSAKKTLLFYTLCLRFKMTERGAHVAKAGKTLADFGYGFNEEGKLRQISDTGALTDKGFEFNTFKEHQLNQKRYEELGEVITEHVYGLLESNGMVKIPVPESTDESSGTFVFSTTKQLPKDSKLLVLIHGSGVVRAGQWSRSLIINHSLAAGTQLPYLERARKMGFEVISTNTNDNNRRGKPIQSSEDSVEHAVYVFEKYIIPSNPKAVAIVAHSYGGIVTMELARKFPEFFKTKVFAVGLTDSVHMAMRGGREVKDHIRNIARNWVTSAKPLDTSLTTGDPSDVPHYSAGHMQHEWTSYAAMSAVFDFISRRYDDFIKV